MKLKFYLIPVIAAMLLSPACSSDDDEGITPGGDGYVGTEQFTGDVETFTDFVLRTQHIRTTFLRLTSDGFTPDTRLLMGDWLGYMEKHPETVDALIDEAAWMSQHEEEYVQAIRNLENSQVLTVTTRGILSDLVNSFLVWKNEDKIYRNKLMSVYDKLTEAQKQEAFEWIDPRRRGGAKNKEEWAAMIRKGKLDKYACHYYKECYQGVLGFEDHVAPDETPWKLISLSGLKYIQAGGAVEASALGIIAPSSVAAGASVAQLAEDSHDLANAKDGTGFLEGVMKVAGDALGSMGSLVKESVNWTYDAGQAVYYTAKSFITGDEVESPQKDKGAVQVEDTDKDKGSKADIIIAQKVKPDPKEPSIHIGLGAIKKGGEYIWNVILKAGEWFVTAIDKAGNKATVKVDVKAGKITQIKLETKKAMEEEEGKVEGTAEEIQKKFFGFKVACINSDYKYLADWRVLSGGEEIIADSVTSQTKMTTEKEFAEVKSEIKGSDLILTWDAKAKIDGEEYESYLKMVIDARTGKLKKYNRKDFGGGEEEEVNLEKEIQGEKGEDSNGKYFRFHLTGKTDKFKIKENREDAWLMQGTEEMIHFTIKLYDRQIEEEEEDE